MLAGDIDRPGEAIAWAAGLAKPAIYVPGNHEFYGSSIGATLRDLRALSAGTNVRVLDDDELVVDGVRFLGSTLWTDFMVCGDGEIRSAAMADARRFVRDFSRIRAEDGADALFTPDDAPGEARASRGLDRVEACDAS